MYITDGPTENWRNIINLNVLGLSVCTKEALQSMKERGVDDGHIIHINRSVGNMVPTLWFVNPLVLQNTHQRGFLKGSKWWIGRLQLSLKGTFTNRNTYLF